MSTSPASSARKLKILMLHGYTQSGPLFHAKTRALEKALIKAFPAPPPAPHKALAGTLPLYPGGIQLIYPTAPMRLRPSDIPGYTSTNPDGGEEAESDCWGWWRRNEGTGSYVGLEDGLATIAATIREAGGIDGVIGFSQGAAAAGLVASLLETGRVEAFKKAAGEGKKGMPYPSSFIENDGRTVINPPLQFAVSYSGFYAADEACKAFYEPAIATRMLHFIGSLDSVVEESRCLKFVEACEEGGKRVIYHPGGHFVPIGKEMVGQLVGFIRECCTEKVELEESVEDMDVPF